MLVSLPQSVADIRKRLFSAIKGFVWISDDEKYSPHYTSSCVTDQLQSWRLMSVFAPTVSGRVQWTAIFWISVLEKWLFKSSLIFICRLWHTTPFSKNKQTHKVHQEILSRWINLQTREVKVNDEFCIFVHPHLNNHRWFETKLSTIVINIV